MAEQTPDTFRMTPELGRRLRSLRVSAGLTQNQLAARMGRKGREAGSLCSRLEAGATEYPTLALIADYLRACRAGFGDILDLLTAYTSKPPQDETAGRDKVARLVEDLPQKTGKRVDRYDIKTAAARRHEGEPALPAEQRLERAEKLATGFAERDRVSLLLRGLWPRLQAPATLVNSRAAYNYCQQLWAVLNKTRGRSARVRARAVADLLLAAIKAGNLPEPDIRLMHTEVRELFRRDETAGFISARRKPARPRPRKLKPTERELLSPQMRQNEVAVAQARLAVNRVLEQEKATDKTKTRWRNWLSQLVETGLSTATDSPERTAKVAKLTPSAPDTARAPSIAALFLATLDRYKATAQPT